MIFNGREVNVIVCQRRKVKSYFVITLLYCSADRQSLFL